MRLLLLCLAATLAGCHGAPRQPGGVLLSSPRWIVPSASLPPEAACDRANNNVALALHSGRLWLAWRTAPSHFASPRARLHVLSSADLGQSWRFERTLAPGHDVREPCFVPLGSKLVLSWFEAGQAPWTFAPTRMRRIVLEDGHWSEPEAFGLPGEVPWAIELHAGEAWMTSYHGPHYGLRGGDIAVRFQRSADALTWRPAGADAVVYRGGVSEAAFAFDAAGDLWAITRNEDGDPSGFGSHLVDAAAAAPSAWRFPPRSDPQRYDSPRLFRHANELYLLARRDLGGPFDLRLDLLPFALRRIVNLVAYSLRPKRTALYRLDRPVRRVVHLLDLPSAGDTAFPSVVALGEGRFLVANYSSPLDRPDIPWLAGQLGPTGIYLLTLDFGTER